MATLQQELLALMETEYVPGNSWGLEDTVQVRIAQSVANGELTAVVRIWPLRHLPEFLHLYERMNLDVLESMGQGPSEGGLEGRRVHVTRQLLDQYAGRYEREGGGFDIIIHRRNDRLYLLVVRNRFTSEMVPVASDHFVIAQAPDNEYKFPERETDHDVMRYYEGKPIKYHRVAEATAP